MCGKKSSNTGQHVATQPTWLKHLDCYNRAYSKCIWFKYLTVSRSFSLASMGISYNSKQYINCNTTHAVYLITYNLCRLQYVVSTSCSMKVFICSHLSHVNGLSPKHVSVVSLHCIEVHAVSPLFSFRV